MTKEEKREKIIAEVIDSLSEDEKMTYLVLYMREKSDDFLAKLVGFGNWENYAAAN